MPGEGAGFFSPRSEAGKGPEWYQGLWDWQPGVHRWAMEASTSHTQAPTHLGAAPFLARLNAEIRLIYVVRDPIERIRSHYLHLLAAGHMKTSLKDPLAPGPVLYSNYHYQLLPYEACRPAEELLVLKYERFRLDPLGVAKECCEFLGLDSSFEFSLTGMKNAGNDYALVLLGQCAVELGLVDAIPPELTGRGVRPGLLLDWLGGKMTDADPDERLHALVREMESRYIPSALQIEEIHERLDADLARFEARHGINPWLPVPVGSH